MQIVLITLGSVLGISLISFIGAATLAWKQSKIRNILSVLVALAAGTMMGTAFLHLLPEATELLDAHEAFQYVLLSFIAFFSIEKFLHWRHCHDASCNTHSFGYMNILGDGVHNFLDGLIIAAAYATSVEVGIAATIAVVLHEIPQEIGDFGVLLKAGYSTSRALLLNFVGALTAVLGGILGLLLTAQVAGFVQFLTPFAAGSFLYIAATDLLPQLHEETEPRQSIRSMVVFLIGVLLVYLLQTVSHGVHE